MNLAPVRLLGRARQHGLLQGVCAFAFMLHCTGPAHAQETYASSLFGGPGIIDRPSARMAPDGELGFGASFFKNTQRYSLNFQALSWLSASFRYSGLKQFDPQFPVYYDRSFALKARLWDETDIFPAVAIGINDLVGTGVYTGEYLVASKAIGPVDVTAGIGWGRLATANTVRNPLTLLSKSFESRTDTTSGVGQFTLGQYFRGKDIGLFGGINWRTPIEGLTLKAEYSSDAYVAETLAGNLAPSSQVNFGASYEIFEKATIALSWLYGRTLALNLAFAIDPTKDNYPARLQPEMVPTRLRTPQERLATTRRARQAQTNARQTNPVDAIWGTIPQVTNISVDGRTLQIQVQDGRNISCNGIAGTLSRELEDIDALVVNDAAGRRVCSSGLQTATNLFELGNPGASTTDAVTANPSAPMLIDGRAMGAGLAARIRAELLKQNIMLEAFTLEGVQAWIYYSNNTYFHEVEAVERIARTLMALTPPQTEQFHIVNISAGVPSMRFDVLRGTLERNVEQTGEFDLLREGDMQLSPPTLGSPFLSQGRINRFPRFSWSLFPQFRQQLFDPSNPFAMQFLAAAEATLQITPQLLITGQIEASLFDNFNVGRLSDSVLPHVRTDFVRYFADGKNGVDNLQAQYMFRLAPNVFGRARFGYLESMFGGFGGELLWRPNGQRWALGADFYRLRQRNFDRLLGFQNYEVNTGHVSLYYQSPWYNLNFVVRAGQYLAGDRGLTFEMSRRFSTGVEVGAFVTKTNVSAARFGEGSFDKGIFFRLPLNWSLPIATQRELSMALRPVQRDGGQRLSGDATLYEETRRSSYPEIMESRN